MVTRPGDLGVETGRSEDGVWGRIRVNLSFATNLLSPLLIVHVVVISHILELLKYVKMPFGINFIQMYKCRIWLIVQYTLTELFSYML